MARVPRVGRAGLLALGPRLAGGLPAAAEAILAVGLPPNHYYHHYISHITVIITITITITITRIHIIIISSSIITISIIIIIIINIMLGLPPIGRRGAC